MRVLDRPRDGSPKVVATQSGFNRFVSDLAKGCDAIACDAERAHGFRYWEKAYLVQFRTDETGTVLVDPIAFRQAPVADLSAISSAVGEREWVLHAASNDLACLREIGIVPRRLFDTALAGQLLGYQKTALATLIERHFDVTLLKAHSYEDWSRRPLPAAWINYAALDVEFLVELKDILAQALDDAGRADWARQEFAHVLAVGEQEMTPPSDPWRKLKHLSTITTRRGVCAARNLWFAREQIAKKIDRTPGWIIPNEIIIASAQRIAENQSIDAALDFPEYDRRLSARNRNRWVTALKEALDTPAEKLPPSRQPSVGVGTPRQWERHEPQAFARWAPLREAVDAVAHDLDLSPSVLLSPAVLRQVAFAPEPDIAQQLHDLDARPWQIELVTQAISDALISVEA